VPWAPADELGMTKRTAKILLLCLLLVAAVLAAGCSASAAPNPDGSFRVSREVKQAA